MKKFETPTIEMEMMDIDDVIATSLCSADNCPNLTPCPADE